MIKQRRYVFMPVDTSLTSFTYQRVLIVPRTILSIGERVYWPVLYGFAYTCWRIILVFVFEHVTFFLFSFLSVTRERLIDTFRDISFRVYNSSVKCETKNNVTAICPLDNVTLLSAVGHFSQGVDQPRKFDLYFRGRTKKDAGLYKTRGREKL